MPKFFITENTILAIGSGNINEFRNKCQNRRGLARVLAAADLYAGNSFSPLSKIIGVSIETVEIRLEELNRLAF